jgi:hypothetical protein
MSIKFTDVRPMIERKILRNAMAVELIEINKEIFQKEIEIRTAYLDSCGAKLQLFETMNLIEEMQLNTYDKNREISIMEIYKDIEEIESELDGRIAIMQKEVKKNKKLNMFLISKIEEINKIIPSEGIATNYNVNSKEEIGG